MTRLTIEIDDKLAEKLCQAAKAEATPPETLASKILTCELERYSQYIEAVHVGIREADAGSLIPHAAVIAELESDLAQAEMDEISEK